MRAPRPSPALVQCIAGVPPRISARSALTLPMSVCTACLSLGTTCCLGSNNYRLTGNPRHNFSTISSPARATQPNELRVSATHAKEQQCGTYYLHIVTLKVTATGKAMTPYL